MKFSLTKVYKTIGLLALWGGIVCVSGCATAKKGDSTPFQNAPSSGNTAQEMGPPEPPGPLPPEHTLSYGPDPVQLRPVVLVLGPGLARGFAYAGVLEALAEARIPVGAIFGTEMGSLIGALYSMSTSQNQFEWGLQKFKEDVFHEQGFLSKLTSSPSKGDRLESQLRQVFGDKDLLQARIPLRIVIQSQDTGIPITLDHGSVTQAVRAAMAVRGRLAPGTWQDQQSTYAAVAANSTRPFPVSEARTLGIGPVIAVNVLSDSESKIAFDELKSADLVIRPDLTGIQYLDFRKKSEAAFRGKSAIIGNIPEIRHLVGVPPADSSKLTLDRRSAYQ